VIFSALDNLIKGAAGQAVQNFNLMHEFDERMGLLEGETLAVHG
jgi:N-acetyl-gamma-glutamyl-phosphate reductase